MSVRLPTGLCNIGNTWFANSVLQWLLHTPEMVQFLSNIKETGSQQNYFEAENTLHSERSLWGRSLRQRKLTSFNLSSDYPTYCWSIWGIKQLMQEMENSSYGNIYPLGLKDIIKKVFGESVEFGRQQDAHEFLIMLLHAFEGSECLKKAEKSKKKIENDEYSFDIEKNSIQLNEIFEGSFTSTITCQKWKKTNKNIQKFQDINLVSYLRIRSNTCYLW